jgi:hypothetical protein
MWFTSWYVTLWAVLLYHVIVYYNLGLVPIDICGARKQGKMMSNIICSYIRNFEFRL